MLKGVVGIHLRRRTELQRPAFPFCARYCSTTCRRKPVHSGQMLLFQSSPTRSVPANVRDFDRRGSQGRQTQCQAHELTSAFQCCAFEGYVLQHSPVPCGINPNGRLHFTSTLGAGERRNANPEAAVGETFVAVYSDS